MVAASLLTLSVAVSGCAATNALPAAYSPEQAQMHLPDLDDMETVRDEVARAEFAVSQRAAELRSLSVECPKCEKALGAVSVDAQDRLELSGGLWEPWGDFTHEPDAGSYVALPPEVVEAPFDVAGLVDFMTQTALQQLDEVGGLDDDFSDEKVALAGILIGRLGSAQALAVAFDLPPTFAKDFDDPSGWTYVDGGDPEDAEAPEDTADPEGAGTSEDAAVGRQSEGLSQSGGESKGPSSSANEPTVSEKSNNEEFSADEADLVTQTVTHLDCARSTLLALPEGEVPVDVKLEFASWLEKHNREYLSLGVQDARPLRCTLKTADAPTLIADVVTHQVLLLVDGPQAAAPLAAGAIVEDMIAWGQISPKTLPTASFWPDQEPPPQQEEN